MTLDTKLSKFKAVLKKTVEKVIEYYATSEDRPVISALDASELKRTIVEPLPDSPMELRELVEDIERRILPNATFNTGPHCHAYVVSGGTFAGVIAETIAGALSQNGARWHLSPITVEIEKLVIAWISSFIGYRDDCGGVFVSGGSMANQVCLTVALSAKAPWNVKREGLSGHLPLTIYASDEVHACIAKSVAVLGIGIDNLCLIPAGPDKTLDPVALEKRIEADRRSGLLPFCVVASAGTVNTGAVDPMDAIADVCERQSCWLHVDGAYGGLAASLPEERHRFAGLERADSVALVPHKWLYVPVEDGVALVRSEKELQQFYRFVPEYLSSGHNDDRYEPSEHCFELSRSFKSFKVWANFKAYGADGLRSAIQANIDDVRACADEIEARPTLELLSPPTLSIVCFRYRGRDRTKWSDDEYLNYFNARILDEIETDGRVFLTGTRLNGRVVLRICNINHRTTFSHLYHCLDVIEELGTRVVAEA